MITLFLYWSLGAVIVWLVSRHRLPSLGSFFAAGLSAAVFSGVLSALFFSSLKVSTFFLQLSPVLLVALVVWKRPEKRAFLFPVGSHSDRAVGLAFSILALVGSIGVVRLCGVPVSMYDVLSYHLPLASQFNDPATLGEVMFSPSTFYARLPLGAPILEAPFATVEYAGGLALGIQLLIAASILAGASCCWRIAGMLGGRWSVRALAACLYLFHYLCLKGMIQAVYDPVVALLTIASLEMLLSACSRKGTLAQSCLSGVMVGTAISLKLNAVGVAAVPLGFVALWLLTPALKERQWGKVLRVLLPLAGGIALVLVPWLVRAMIVGGHPMHPFRGFDDFWTARQADFVVQVHQPQTPLGLGWWHDVFTRSKFLGYTIPFTSISWLPFLALLCLQDKKRRWTLLGIVLAGMGGYGAWLTVRLNPDRFLLPAVTFLLPVAAVSVGYWLHRPGKRAPSIVLCGLVVLCIYLEEYRWLPGNFAWRTQERVAMLDQLGSGMMQTVATANEKTSERDGKLLLFFEARPTLFTCDYQYHTVWDQPQWKPLLKKAENARQFEQGLMEQGITGIFVNEFEWGRFLDFYAKDKLPAPPLPTRYQRPNTPQAPPRWMGQISIKHPRALDGLSAYLPYDYAAFDHQELEILLRFLQEARGRAMRVAPAGPMAEIWFAPLGR